MFSAQGTLISGFFDNSVFSAQGTLISGFFDNSVFSAQGTLISGFFDNSVFSTQGTLISGFFNNCVLSSGDPDFWVLCTLDALDGSWPSLDVKSILESCFTGVRS